ncbi:hypothetical protein C8R44DRAFT_862470 [Mycena epipterygia]|nr:hypothetical protein C8R44DRAFT_862470 [Mycena epipterygia]
MICEHVDTTSSFLGHNNRLRSLASLARTSKLIGGVALDVLWREQDTVMHALKCMPSDAWAETPGRGKTKIFRLLRSITPADWERPLVYLQRIRTLDCRFTPALSVETLEAMVHSLPEEFICRNLRSLSWPPKSSTMDAWAPYLDRFLGPGIESITITLDDSEAQLSILPMLALKYPNLKRADIEGPSSSSELCRSLSTFACGLNRIETLNIATLNRAAFQHLSHLPSLKCLNLYAPEAGDLDTHTIVSSIPPPTSFPVLRYLDFFSTTIEFAIEFLQGLSRCPVQDFDVNTRVLTTKTVTRTFYIALAKHLSHSTLKELSVNGDYCEFVVPDPDLDEIEQYAVSGRALAELFCFVNLTLVDLRPPVGFKINDVTAWDMARSWPRIQTLALRACTDVHCRPAMTLKGLVAFATHCPVLTELGISFNASTIPYSSEKFLAELTVAPQMKLRELHVGQSPISQPAAVARFLSATFPNLTKIATEWEYTHYDFDPDDDDDAFIEPRHRKWLQVHDMVPVLTAVRKEERRRWRGISPSSSESEDE